MTDKNKAAIAKRARRAAAEASRLARLPARKPTDGDRPYGERGQRPVVLPGQTDIYGHVHGWRDHDDGA